jgi:uncharacterized membrane protein
MLSLSLERYFPVRGINSMHIKYSRRLDMVLGKRNIAKNIMSFENKENKKYWGTLGFMAFYTYCYLYPQLS